MAEADPGRCSWRTGAVGRRQQAGAKTLPHGLLAFLASTQTRGSTADSTVTIIETAFHYVNCHPRGDPVSSLSNDRI